MTKKIKIFVTIAIISALVLGFGLSYAYFTWQSEETAVRVTVDGVPISYNVGEDITGNLLPTLTKEEGISKDITVNLTRENYESYIVFYLKINELPDALRHASFKYEMYRNNVLSKSGNFSEVNVNDIITISQSNALSNVADTYTLYLWIDGNMENPIEMTEKTFSFTLYARAENEYTETGGVLDAPDGCFTETNIIKKDGVDQAVSTVHCPIEIGESTANAPELYEGLIPIRWTNENVIVKADATNSGTDAWYNYDSKMWANAIMVTSDTRDTYMNASAGTQIVTSDILAYWVWIPRYRYELFNATFESGTSPQTINIAFEEKTSKMSGRENGEWLTHPAFTFGDTELSGFWVAKFEPTGAAGAGNLTVLPGVASLRSQTVAVQYATAQQFANTAYLTATGVALVDAHMMKNMEWGAVAYLSHSNYGKNEEITINSNSSFYTGGAAGNAYLTNVGQSTTGNVYGIYDMSGNAYEYVMGNYASTTGSSTLTIANLDEKYIDIYGGTTVASSYLGDALGETAGWYSDYTNFVTSTSPWFDRGGSYNDSTNAGAFFFNSNNGGAYGNVSFRPLLSALQ